MKKAIIILAIILFTVTAITFIWIKKAPNGNELIKESIDSQMHSNIAQTDVERFFAKVKEQEQKIKTLSYSAQTSMGSDKMNAKFYKKDNKKRVESLAAGVATVNIIDLDTNKAISYIPAEKKAIVQNLDSSAVADMSSQYESLSKEEMAKYILGEKTQKNGYSCQMLIAKSADNNDRKNVNICISEDYGIPIFVEAEGVIMNVMNISRDSLDDELFILPKDVEIIEK